MPGKKDLTSDHHNRQIATSGLQMAIQDHQTVHFQKFQMINKIFLTELQMDMLNQIPNILIIKTDRGYTVVQMASPQIFPVFQILRIQDQMVTQLT